MRASRWISTIRTAVPIDGCLAFMPEVPPCLVTCDADAVALKLKKRSSRENGDRAGWLGEAEEKSSGTVAAGDFNEVPRGERFAGQKFDCGFKRERYQPSLTVSSLGRLTFFGKNNRHSTARWRLYFIWSRRI